MNNHPRQDGSQLAEFVRFCEGRSDERFDDPAAFQRFSVARYRTFWQHFLEWADPPRSGSPEPICSDDRCEFATFFPNLELNYAECLLRSNSPADDLSTAIIGRRAEEPSRRISRGELRQNVRALAAQFRELGVDTGDRVAAVTTNTPEAAVGALAAAAVGATFSSTAPDMGPEAILSRFEQLQPVLLLVSLEGGRGSAPADVAERVAAVAARLPSLKAVVALDEGPAPEALDLPVRRLSELVAEPPAGANQETWPHFPFNHPLFILFTSGTTGPPKCIVHGAGGTLLEHLKEHRLHGDLRPQDTMFFQTSAAWMMWNWQLSALACGATIVVYDGPVREPATLWRIVAEEEVSVFGTSPPYLQLCQDSGYSPRRQAPARWLRSVLSTGSVLRDWQFDWVAEEVGPVKLQSISGGTDIIGCFALGHPQLPVRRGMLQSRSLGLDVQALETESTPSDSEIGELICRNPFPSRPLGLLGDENGSRFHDAYFSQNEGVWTHGDLIEFDVDGQARIHGRSDGVLNIQGVRIGPSELYQALRGVPQVAEAMAVEQARETGSRLVLLVLLAAGAELDRALARRIRETIAEQTSPLHVPELVVAVDELPVTHSGKRSERAGRDAVSGRAAVNARALANPAAVEQISAAVAAAERSLAEREERAAAEDAPTLERVRAIWEGVLGLEGLADEDQFFALGGTSLQAIRVFFGIRDRLGVDLPPSALIEAPTIAALAALVDDPVRAYNPVALIRPGGEGPPLHLVHDVYGDVLAVRQLASALESEVPVFALRGRGLYPGEEPQTSVEEIASTYLEAIRANQPHGPYRLAGHSFGGMLAFEIARRLTEDGEEVDFLGVIDAELDPKALPLRRRLGRLAVMPLHLAKAAMPNPVAAARSFVHSEGWMQEASPVHQELARVYLRAAAEFRPRPYRGPMTYFVPEVRRFHLYPDPVPVWREITAGEFDLITVPGEHVEMISGEAARVVARAIDAALGEPAATGVEGR